LTFSPEEFEARKRLASDFTVYAAACLKIRTKSGAIEPLRLNRAQQYLHGIAEKQRAETGKVRIIGLKGRQQGFSTYVEGRIYWRVTHQKGVRAFILTHEEEATKNLFEMANRYHEHCPELVRPHTGAANANELNFDLLDSGYKVGTARTKGTGRSSTLQYFHWSEVAHSQNAEEHAAGVMQAVPDMVGTEMFLESTANGPGNLFHSTWQKAEAGENDFIPVFIPWFWQEEYRRLPEEGFSATPEEAAIAAFFDLDVQQIVWRRAKISELGSELLFKQEYPCTAAEAFQFTGMESFIPAELLLKARKSQVDPYGPLVVGVDPARFGDDRTAIAFRRTRKVTKIDAYTKKDTMEVAGICSRILKNHSPAMMFIDVVGLGAGVVDRLRELGWGSKIIAVNGGEKASKEKNYLNRRAEMWGEMKRWFQDGPVQVPDDDALQADLQGPGFKYDSNQRLALEKKEDMKKRGVRSPDLADAIALTFAAPIGMEMPPLKQTEPEFFGINE
jgi:hypothetical protein